MRSFVRRATIVAVFGLGVTVLSSGCEAKKATEYVAGISTQMTVPRDLKAIRVEVNVGGFQTFCQAYKVYDGKVQLPRSLGAFPSNENALNTNLPITYTILGLTEDFDPASENPLYAFCGQPKVGENGARILRRSRQPYIRDEIRFLPMPLKYSCYDKACGDNETCKGGKCVSDTLADPNSLPRYTPELVDGTGGECFSTAICLGAAAPAIVVDPETCTYAVANSPSAPPPLDPLADPFRQVQCEISDECPSKNCKIVDPGALPPAKKGRCEPLAADTPWEGTNVEIVYDGGLNREILDLDPDEGFVLPDPANPQRFRLAPGLCEMVRGTPANPDGADVGAVCDANSGCKSDVCETRYAAPGCTKDCGICASAHRITAVRASGTCQPKRIGRPFCASDLDALMGAGDGGVSANPNPPNDCGVVELKPPRAALMVVVDNTQGHAAFFNADEIQAVELPLKDPAFEKTDLSLIYAPVAGGCAANAAPVLPFEAAATGRVKLIDNFLAFANNPASLVPGAPSYEGALASSYAALTALPNSAYFKRAVVIVGNRDFGLEACAAIPGTPKDLAEAARTAPADPAKPINTYVIQLAKRDPTKALDDD
ncbi:MAG: hypothetical protein KF795_30985, partial [Labilithrix sp.]|nr:hypothetical protein [Labilithrix sp.]